MPKGHRNHLCRINGLDTNAKKYKNDSKMAVQETMYSHFAKKQYDFFSFV